MPRDLKTAMVKPLLKKSNSNVISDKGKNVILILLNLSAAFDTVNHTFLLRERERETDTLFQEGST